MVYEHYRNSEKPGIGMIPVHWKCTSLRYALSAIKDGTHGTYARTLDGEYLLSAKNVFPTGLQITDSDSRVSFEDYVSIIANGFPSKGDVLFCGVGTIGRVCYYNYDKPYAFQRSVTFLRSNDKVNSRYLFYYLQSPNIEDDEKLGSNGTAQAGLYMGEIVKLPMLIPPLDEQIAIAAYLDGKTAQINAIVAEAKASIEEYKQWKASIINEAVTKGLDPEAEMADSGDAVIGRIPKHWKMIKITRILDRTHPYAIGDGDHGLIKPTDYNDSGIPYIRVQNLGWGTNLNTENIVYISEEKNELIKNSTLRPNDILFAKTGATIGKTAMVPENMPIANTTSHVGKISVSDKYSARFIFFVLSSQVGYEQFWAFASAKTTRPELTIDEIKSLRLPMPPTIEEQNSIVDYLDAICPRMDSLILEKVELIKELEAYQKSLIFEAVTGKRKVV